MDYLCDTLQKKCSAFFTKEDLYEYRAFDLLQRAKSSEDPSAKESDLKESLEVIIMF